MEQLLGHGVGLRGGTWTYTGDRTVKFRLHGVRMVDDLAVSGHAVWKRYGEVANVDLRVAGRRPAGSTGSWDTRRVGATAVLTGRLDGNRVRLRLPAP